MAHEGSKETSGSPSKMSAAAQGTQATGGLAEFIDLHVHEYGHYGSVGVDKPFLYPKRRLSYIL